VPPYFTFIVFLIIFLCVKIINNNEFFFTKAGIKYDIYFTFLMKSVLIKAKSVLHPTALLYSKSQE